MQNRILAPPHLLEQYQHAQYTAFGVVPTQRASLPSQQQQGVPGEAEMHGGGEGAAEAPGTAGVGDAGPSSSMGGLQASVVGLGEAQASGPRAQTPLPQRASPAAAGAAGPSSVSEGVHAASASGAGERTTEGEGAGAGPATGQPAKRWAMRTVRVLCVLCVVSDCAYRMGKWCLGIFCPSGRISAVECRVESRVQCRLVSKRLVFKRV
eukprot:1160352-Pelagomonas_calceolata.AAC.6